MSQFAHEFFAGTVGGVAQVVIGFPLDSLKVRMQTSTGNASMTSLLREIVNKEGWLALYRGCASPLVGAGVINAVVFTANGTFRRMLGENHIALAGAGAGVVVTAITTPGELLKIRVQIDHEKRYRGILDCGVQTVRAGGFRALYTGLPITILREAPSFASYFWAYDFLKRKLAETSGAPSEAMWIALVAGGLSGIAAWLPCFPQDTIKARIQRSTTPLSITACARQLYREAGWRAFWKGFSPTLVRAVPANSVTFLAYELTMERLAGKKAAVACAEYGVAHSP